LPLLFLLIKSFLIYTSEERRKKMRKVVVTMYVTLDGVMEDPGGAEKFEYGGWSRAYWSDEIGKFKFDELFAADALLLGRKTYEGFAAAWPNYSDEMGFADRMNNLPKHVVSTTLSELTWNNSRLINSGVAEAVAALKEEPGQDILIEGSGQLVHSLMPTGLIDEYRLLVYPVVLGSGKRLFADGSNATLKLVESKPLGGGVVLLTYQPAEEKAEK
jgi:dihydrofolate reductase